KESLQIERRMYQRFWQRTFFRVAFSSVALNLLMALRVLFDDDDETEYWNEVTETYKKAFEDPERGNWLAVDITPLYKWISAKEEYEKDRDVNKYFSLLGHFYDPVKFIIAPTQSFKNKSSVIGKTAMEFMQGENWQGKRFTSLDELLGIDEKGQYKTSSKKYGYRVGDPKGGKNKGQLTRWRKPGDYGPVKYEEIPSFILSTFRGFLPVPLQNGLAFALGEIDAFDAVSHGVGIHLNSKRNYPKLEREYNKAVDEAEIYIRSIKDKLKHGELEEASELSKDTRKTTNSSTILKLDNNIKKLRERCLALEEAGKDDEAEKCQEMIDERMQQAVDLSNSK
ncbi:MAG: hypothetical protein JXP36_06565, partial [Bacteroidales bacterium]|nr:hypothetical protein [Bacteroidales bacterium]